MIANAKLNMYRYFYYNPVKGYDVPAEQAKPLEDEYREDMLYDTIGDEPGSFFGVVSPEGVTLQFYLEDYNGTVRMEIPAPEEQGSYATNVEFGKALQVVKGLGDGFSRADFSELEFQSWR